MSSQKITRILFDDNTVLEFFTEAGEGSRFDDPEVIQKAADAMLANTSDTSDVSDDEINEQMLAAAGLPKDLLYREIPYVRNDELCQYIKTRLSANYRIGLLTADKASARLALGDQYADTFKDILTAEELTDNVRYFFDDALIVSKEGLGFSEASAVCRTHNYTTTQDLARYLAAPPPFVAPTQEGSSVVKVIGKNAASAVPALKKMPKSMQYFVDIAIIVGLGVVAASIFPNEFKDLVEQLYKVMPWE